MRDRSSEWGRHHYRLFYASVTPGYQNPTCRPKKQCPGSSKRHFKPFDKLQNSKNAHHSELARILLKSRSKSSVGTAFNITSKFVHCLYVADQRRRTPSKLANEFIAQGSWHSHDLLMHDACYWQWCKDQSYLPVDVKIQPYWNQMI